MYLRKLNKNFEVMQSAKNFKVMQRTKNLSEIVNINGISFNNITTISYECECCETHGRRTFYFNIRKCKNCASIMRPSCIKGDNSKCIACSDISNKKSMCTECGNEISNYWDAKFIGSGSNLIGYLCKNCQ